MARSLDTAKALNMVLSIEGTLPDWVQLIPIGEVEGRDGRRWKNHDPATIVATFNRRGVPIPIDWEHASEHKAPIGEAAPAAGWITALNARDGFVWGQVDWTARGAASISAKEYRYLSPVFGYDEPSQQITTLYSAGLTNQPNLALTALNRESHSQEVPMKKVLEALGLKPEATEDEAVLAVQALHGDLKTAKAVNSQAPGLDRYVPRADYDATVTRAANAEQKLAASEKAQADAAIEAAVGEALKAGKITPATAEYHKAQCRTEGGLERFKAFVTAAPAVGEESGLDKKTPNGAEKAKALNAEQKAVCTALGIPEAEYQKNVEVN